MPFTYLTPPETADQLRDHAEACQNMSLTLAHYIPQEAIENVNVEGERNAKWRDRWLRRLCERFLVDAKPAPIWQSLLKAEYQRWQTSVKALNAAPFELTARGRLIIGLGGKGPLETGMTVQYLTGLPLIPGSALKGAARAYALYEIAAQLGVPVLQAKHIEEFVKKYDATPLTLLDDLLVVPPVPPKLRGDCAKKLKNLQDALSELKTLSESKEPKNREYRQYRKADPESAQEPSQLSWNTIDALADTALFRAAFGSTAEAGVCAFFDGVVSRLPDTGTLFELDVMTPHFRQYYESLQAPTIAPPNDADDPNPIPFLTVAAETTFAFAVGRRRAADQSQAIDQAIERARMWLYNALTELGIGAKTAAGYGVFGEVR